MITSSTGSTVWPSSSWVTTCGRPTSNSIAFAAHGFDQHAEVQFAAAADRKADAVFFDAQADVGFEFFLQAVADLAAGVEFAFLALERAGVGTEVNLQGWCFDFDDRQCFGVVGIGDGFADLGVGNAG